MWGENKVWLHYLNDIIASDNLSAIFLMSYLHYTRSSKDYASSLEVIDLQKYKVITQVPKVRIAIDERIHKPFIFVVGKN